MPTTTHHPARIDGTAPPVRTHGGPGPATVGVLSTYPPTQCGLATFSAALVAELNRRRRTAGVVRIVDGPESYPGREVAAHLVNGSGDSAAGAVRRLNGFDVVVVQHEYGIYGGPDGADVLDIVAGLTVPTVVVLHTVLQDPTVGQRRILRTLVDAADVLVTMTETARRRVVDTYGARADRVVVIPHGAIDHGPVDAGAGRAQRMAAGRPLVLTWGLLGPGKGIEWAIDALPGLRDLRPRYLVIGKTHPKVLHRDGESYRAGLLRRAEALGVADLVELDDRYIGVGELGALVQRAEVVVLPYDSREQVTSGVLIEAVAAGRPVVSTAFPHAVELLGDGTGLVVPQRSPAALGTALRRVLGEPGLADELARRAAGKAPDLLWNAVADRYQRIADSLVDAALPAVS
ncbi:glycosyltransferase [Pseudonocardia humida]|uniref:Glycosyltransferase n=1 Tax=Pseudonocardia humida TaxID=2800819 RepID=A0ABT0ZTJ2_9PSEU|nr:glycosyltransferase [Pseudonocardia humida]MCO1654024.1 glycosyltransferase [Pseudonocardia humida]